MKKNEMIQFSTLAKQRQERNELTQESFEEKAHLILITHLNKSDICQSEDGKRFSRKLVSRINNYYKGMSQEQATTTFLLINNAAAVDDFKDYLLPRVKGKELQEYEVLFNDNKFINDVKNLLRIKSYDHKQQMDLQGLNGFQSGTARCESSIAMVKKNGRISMHESIARAKSTYISMADGSKELLTDGQLEQLMKPLIKEYEEMLRNQVEDILRIESSKNLRLENL